MWRGESGMLEIKERHGIISLKERKDVLFLERERREIHTPCDITMRHPTLLVVTRRVFMQQYILIYTRTARLVLMH